jgi:hypothetical protein
MRVYQRWELQEENEMHARLVIAALFITAGLCACGSDDDSTADESPTDQTDQVDQPDDGDTVDDGENADDGDTDDGDNGDNGDNGNEGEATEPPSVGSSIQGVAVATSSGGEEACKPQSENGLLPDALVQGSPVTVRDAGTGEEIGTGQIDSTDFVEHTGETTELGPPPWTCSFIISATLSSTPENITVQIGDLEPFAATLSDGQFSIEVPSTETPTESEGTTGTLPPTDTTFVTVPVT